MAGARSASGSAAADMTEISTSPEELWEKIAYIHNNPVKRKLVPRATEWLWSCAAVYAKLRGGPLPVDNTDLPWLR